jgi:hypothetical protein
MRVVIKSQKFKRDMDNIMKYSFGFLDGTQQGKTAMYTALAPEIAELASQYIDANARISPETLHHIYEWYQTGSPKARLFDIDFSVSKIGITFTSNFKQSTTIKDGSNVPFYNKAEIMEQGASVIIKPKRSNVLAFQVDGEDVFTSNPVIVNRPGGDTQGQFTKAINEFFGLYFKQSFLTTSGLGRYFSNPMVYKKNIGYGKRSGRYAGIKTGFQWVAKAGAMR